MVQIPDNLFNDLDRQLESLGLEVTGDDDEGYTIRCGTVDLRTDCGTRFDSAGEALAVAMTGLLDRVADLAGAAAEVVRRWERDDLAEAVRELDVCVKAVAPSRKPVTRPAGGRSAPAPPR